MVVFLVAVAGLPGPVFLTTVPVLTSLVSLMPLARRPVRVAGRDGGAALGPGGAAMGFLPAGAVAAAAPLDAELASDAVVTLRPDREAFALSTMLDSTLVTAAERLVPLDLSGEPGREIRVFVGDGGRSQLARRELDDVGDSTCAGRT